MMSRTGTKKITRYLAVAAVALGTAFATPAVASASPGSAAFAAAQGSCPPPSTASAPSKITAGERSTILQIHNQARAATKASPPLGSLSWDSSLANAAQGWANIIGPSKHSECHSGARSSGQGENIADYGTVQAGVQFWYSEKSKYKYPTPVATGAPYLHYTQMVWRGTQRIGCGKAPSAKYSPNNIVLVCRYSPAGNVFGHAPY